MRLDTQRLYTQRLRTQRPDTRPDMQRRDMRRPDMRGSPDMLKCQELKNRLRDRDILRQRTTEPRTCTCHHTALAIIHKKWFQARTSSRLPDFQLDLLQTSAFGGETNLRDGRKD
jgi:hypothetical protein